MKIFQRSIIDGRSVGSIGQLLMRQIAKMRFRQMTNLEGCLTAANPIINITVLIVSERILFYPASIQD